jgi:hypothetical protein
MRIMQVTGRFDTPAARVWEIVSDFGNLGRWNPAIISCSAEGAGVGMVRTFKTATATVKERLLELDSGAMQLVYEIVSGSSIKVRAGRLAIAVTEDGPAASVLTWGLSGEPDGVDLADLSAQTEKRYSGRLEDLGAVLKNVG